MTNESKLREALEEILQAVCGETGFAAAVRSDTGTPYPWPALDLAEEKARAALTAAPQPVAPGAVDAQAGPSDELEPSCRHYEACFGGSGSGCQPKCKMGKCASVAHTAAPSAADLPANPSDAEILALTAGEVHFSESPSRFPEFGHGTQYHAGAPGVLSFARAILARFAAPAGEYLAHRETLASNRGYRTGVEDGKALGATSNALHELAVQTAEAIADIACIWPDVYAKAGKLAKLDEKVRGIVCAPVSDAAAQAVRPVAYDYPVLPQGYHPSQFDQNEPGAYDADDMRAYVDADRVQRATPPSVSGIGEAAEPVAYMRAAANRLNGYEACHKDDPGAFPVRRATPATPPLEAQPQGAPVAVEQADAARIEWLSSWQNVPGKPDGHGEMGYAIFESTSDGVSVDSEFGGGVHDTFREAVDAARLHCESPPIDAALQATKEGEK